MSTEDRLQALEQLVFVMHGEVLLARGTAARAEQRATDAITRLLTARGDGVFDTRVFGTQDSWRHFQGRFFGYAEAVTLNTQAMIESEMLTELATTRPAGLGAVVVHADIDTESVGGASLAMVKDS